MIRRKVCGSALKDLGPVTHRAASEKHFFVFGTNNVPLDAERSVLESDE